MTLASQPRAVQAGDEVAGYLLEEEVGRGGMGVVFRATQTALQRTVALKVIAPERAGDPSFRARFVRECRIAAALDHPNVIPIYDAQDADGLLYMAMAYVDGPDLGTLVRDEGALDPRRAVQLVAQVAGALEAAHERGLVHRDVKPPNVLVGSGDRAVLTDFGLATTGMRPDGLTQTGQFVGSIDFVAPEQISAEAVDARADQYSLGGVLHFALSGRPPFERPTAVATLFAHMSDPPPAPSAHGAPAAFDDVVARAMAKAPDDRFPTVGDLARAALAAVEGLPPPPVTRTAARALGVGQAHGDAGTFVAAAPGAPPPPGDTAPEAEPEDPLEQVVGRRAGVAFALDPAFRYVHQPLDAADAVLPMLGNEDVVESLVQRIRHSAGGSFLVTGFRGVGKTTVIHRALERLEADGGVLPIHLTVARPRSAEELLFDVIRRLFEALVDAGVLESLSAEVRRRLVLAYMRTSLAFKATHERGSERTAGLTLGPAGGMLDRIGPKLELSGKATESLATEAGFLAYSPADVEHDFFRIVDLLRQGDPSDPAPQRAWRRVLRRPPATPPAPWNGKVVVVLDELDKLTAHDGTATIEALLTALKNLFTTRGVHFLFVGGPDLHQMALQAGYRGNSVYDSVFGWQLYVPCAWEATDRLLDALVADARGQEATLASFADYLRFKARGVPRLLLAELNAFVAWDGPRPMIVLAGLDLARVEFYAGLERALRAFTLGDDDAPRAFAVPIDEDRWRVGAYYVTDWILRTKGERFTAAQIVSADDGGALDPLLVHSERKVQRLVEHLVEHGVVERLGGRGAGETLFGDAPSPPQEVFRLAADVGVKLTSFAAIDERERAELGSGGIAAAPWADSGPGLVVGGRYELLEELDRTGLGHVFEARDVVTGEALAVKLTDAADPHLVDRFERKARIAAELDVPGVVRTREVFRVPDGRVGVAMELLEGAPLHVLLRGARLTPRDAVKIAASVLDAVARLHEHGVGRLDLKPSSIMVDDALRPTIMDLGVVKRLGVPAEEPGARAVGRTEIGVAVGTPAYAAPEQLIGAPAGPAADQFAVAAILVELLSGRPPRGEGDLPTILRRALSEDVALDAVPASGPLRAVLARALARDPAARFAGAAELAEALRRTPEGAPG